MRNKFALLYPLIYVVIITLYGAIEYVLKQCDINSINLIGDYITFVPTTK